MTPTDILYRLLMFLPNAWDQIVSEAYEMESLAKKGEFVTIEGCFSWNEDALNSFFKNERILVDEDWESLLGEVKGYFESSKIYHVNQSVRLDFAKLTNLLKKQQVEPQTLIVEIWTWVRNLLLQLHDPSQNIAATIKHLEHIVINIAAVTSDIDSYDEHSLEQLRQYLLDENRPHLYAIMEVYGLQLDGKLNEANKTLSTLVGVPKEEGAGGSADCIPFSQLTAVLTEHLPGFNALSGQIDLSFLSETFPEIKLKQGYTRKGFIEDLKAISNGFVNSDSKKQPEHLATSFLAVLDLLDQINIPDKSLAVILHRFLSTLRQITPTLTDFFYQEGSLSLIPKIIAVCESLKTIFPLPNSIKNVIDAILTCLIFLQENDISVQLKPLPESPREKRKTKGRSDAKSVAALKSFDNKSESQHIAAKITDGDFGASPQQSKEGDDTDSRWLQNITNLLLELLHTDNLTTWIEQLTQCFEQFILNIRHKLEAEAEESDGFIRQFVTIINSVENYDMDFLDKTIFNSVTDLKGIVDWWFATCKTGLALWRREIVMLSKILLDELNILMANITQVLTNFSPTGLVDLKPVYHFFTKGKSPGLIFVFLALPSLLIKKASVWL